ncbi:hypothetical protein V1509DRAFT_610695 [Lipomyces kononenkoae]
MQLNKIFDTLVIGGGPAGIAAAMALGRACRTVALFDSQEYRNEGVPMMHNVVRHDGEKPEIYRSAAVEDIMKKYETITFIDTCITTARHVDGERRPFFEITNDKGVVWTGWKLVLATGTKDILPDIKGYKELWGHGIVHCLFCHGYENRGGHVGVLGFESAKELDPVLMAFPLSRDRVTVFTNGVSTAADSEVQEARAIAAARGARFDDRVIESISANPGSVGIRLHFEEGPDEHLRMLLSNPPTVNRAANIIKSLGLETNTGPDNHVVTKSPLGETNLRGCFVAGDTSTPAKAVSVALAFSRVGFQSRWLQDHSLE